MRRFTANTRGRRRAIAITSVNVSVSAFFSLAALSHSALVNPAASAGMQDPAMIFGMYAAARSLSILVLTFAAILMRSLSGLIVLGALAGINQFSDAAIGLYRQDLPKTLGPLVLACLQFYALYVLEKASRQQD